jgi:hypothetical protein
LLGLEWKKDAGVSSVDTYEEAGNFIEDLIEACRRIAQKLSRKKAGTTVIDTMTKLMKMVPNVVEDWQESSARGALPLPWPCEKHIFQQWTLPVLLSESPHQSGEKLGDGSAKDSTYHASDEDKPESSE